MLISEDDIIRCSSRREGQALEENLGAGISRGGRGLARPPLSGLPPAHCKTACIPHRHYIACFYCFIIIYHQIIHFLTIKSTISLFAPLQKNMSDKQKQKCHLNALLLQRCSIYIIIFTKKSRPLCLILL